MRQHTIDPIYGFIDVLEEQNAAIKIGQIVGPYNCCQYGEVSAAAYCDVRSEDVLETGMPLGKEYGVVFFPTHWELELDG